jgi:hypothetical protein
MADPDPVVRKLDAIRAELKDCAEPALDFPAMALKAGVATGIAHTLMAVVDAILENHKPTVSRGWGLAPDRIVCSTCYGDDDDVLAALWPCRTYSAIARVLQVS